jgi:hypothetical protein
LFFLVDQVAISFIIPNHWLNVIHIEVDCKSLVLSPISPVGNDGRHTPELVLQRKPSKKG